MSAELILALGEIVVKIISTIMTDSSISTDDKAALIAKIQATMAEIPKPEEV